MFAGCDTIKEIDLTNFNASLVTNMGNMFDDCIKLTSINLSNLDTSNVKSMASMFDGLLSLTSLNLQNFDTRNVEIIGNMFYNSSALISIDLSNFDTSKVTNMGGIFYNCEKLEYINLKNFDETKLRSDKTTNVFSNIAKNAVICLDSTKAPKLYDIANKTECVVISCIEDWRSVQKKIIIEGSNCVDNCISTQFYHYELKGKCYQECPENTTSFNYKCYPYEEICNPNCKKCNIINSYLNTTCTSCNSDKYLKYGQCVDQCDNGYYLNETEKICECELKKCKECSIESKSNNLCISCNEDNNYYPKLNDQENIDGFINCYSGNILGYYLDNNIYKECYKTCSYCKGSGNDTYHNCTKCSNEYKYQLDINRAKNCYEECPNDISIQSNKNNFYCKIKCPKEYPFEIIETHLCVDICTIYEQEQGLCKINYVSNEESKEAEEKAVENVKEELTKNFNTSNLDKGENIVIKQKDSTISITTTENQKNEKSNNVTTIDLGECEDKIKEEYNITKNKSLYILKIDVNQEGIKIPKIEYEVYYPLFGDSLIKLNLTVCKDLKIDISIPIIIKDNLDKINSSSDYYNDICYTYTSEDGTDVSLADRKKNFINNNLAVCEEDCDFISYDNVLGKAQCSCKVKTTSNTKVGDIKIDKDKLLKGFTDFKNIGNIKVLKCYKAIFKLDAFKYNYANIIFLVIILFFIFVLIYFCHKDYPYLKKIINVIEYFKLNPKDEKEFLNKQKNEERNRKKKGKIKNTNNNNKNKKTSKRKNNIIEDDKNKSNPIKKVKKKQTILNHFAINNINSGQKIKTKKIKDNKNNDDILRINKINKKNKNDINNNDLITIPYQTRKSKNKEYKFPDKLNEKQMKDMFLKINRFTDSELNDFDYQTAINFDNRTYCLYYISLIRTKHLAFFSFRPSFDYNSRIIKIFLFCFNFAVSFFVNALFFNDETMHKIYEEKGSFNFIYNIPQIIYSAIISGIITGIIEFLALTDSSIIDFKEKSTKDNAIIKKKETIKKIQIKLLFFFCISLILLILLWFYLSCFSSVYKNTQVHLIKDTVISFATSMIYPFFIYLLPGLFRISALNARKKDKDCRFKFSKALQIF